MKKERLELIRGSGNIYRDLGIADADVRQLKAILAAEIIKTIDRRGFSVRQGIKEDILLFAWVLRSSSGSKACF